MSPHGDRSVLIVARSGLDRTAALDWAVSQMTADTEVWMCRPTGRIPDGVSYVQDCEFKALDQLRELYEERGKDPQHYAQVSLVMDTPRLSNMPAGDLEKVATTGHATYTQVLLAVQPSEEHLIPRSTRAGMVRVAIEDVEDYHYPGRERFTADANEVVVDDLVRPDGYDEWFGPVQDVQETREGTVCTAVTDDWGMRLTVQNLDRVEILRSKDATSAPAERGPSLEPLRNSGAADRCTQTAPGVACSLERNHAEPRHWDAALGIYWSRTAQSGWDD